MRNILLIEPNYKNKYPPLGLMKISTYHRMLGDKVTFFKGEMKDLVLDCITNLCIIKLFKIDHSINWNLYFVTIRQFFKTKKKIFLEEIPIKTSRYQFLIYNALDNYKNYYWNKEYEKEPLFDRVYISTLFTFYWKITIDTINFAKKLVHDISQVKVGGVTATVLFQDIIDQTNIIPIRGLLDKPGILDSDNNIIIDSLSLDYSILDEIDYKYPENEAYYGYMTRGCIRHCSFCAVPTLEPRYDDFIPITQKLEETKARFGEKRNLLLLDNNVLASDRFSDIIREIMACGFIKGATYIEPNQFDIAIKNLFEGINDIAYLKKSHSLISNLLNKLHGITQQNFYDLLDSNSLLKFETFTKENLLKLAPEISIIYSKYTRRLPRQRHVDFNQGVDARLINSENIQLLSKIPINPLRIAFDSMRYKKPYINAVKLAAKYGIDHLSNYLLFNDKDKPIELYQRLRINIELCEQLNISIYSFPMKFHPIMGKDRFNRDYIGKHWNRKFIRAIQAVLNATKGKIGRGNSFFYKAFGNDESEFLNKLLYMPEPYILYRFFFEKIGYTQKWWEELNSLTEEEMIQAKQIIESNNFSGIKLNTKNNRIMKVLKHYTITKEDIEITSNKEYSLKTKIVN
jgi:hypothetical protein